ncbi:MAG: glycosyltransferase [Planctomycetota bacterium]
MSGPIVQPAPILFCSHVVEWGGAERVLADLFAGIDRRILTPHLAAPGDGPLPAFARDRGVAVHRVPLPSGSPLGKALGLPRAARALRALAAELGCDLLYANTMIAGYAGVLAQRPGLACLWHVHVVTGSKIARAAARRAARVVTPSRAGAAALGRAAVDVVQNGVPAAFFGAAPAGLRQALGIAAGTPLVGICGRIDPDKGHAVLLRASASLRVPHHVVIAGAEAFTASRAAVRGHTDALRRLAAELGLAARVHFLGHRDDLPNVLADLDLVVVPSTASGIAAQRRRGPGRRPRRRRQRHRRRRRGDRRRDDRAAVPARGRCGAGALARGSARRRARTRAPGRGGAGVGARALRHGDVRGPHHRALRGDADRRPVSRGS